MTRTLLRWWYELNYSYCKSQQYLAANRHEIIIATEWSNLADGWAAKVKESYHDNDGRPV